MSTFTLIGKAKITTTANQPTNRRMEIVSGTPNFRVWGYRRTNQTPKYSYRFHFTESLPGWSQGIHCRLRIYHNKREACYPLKYKVLLNPEKSRNLKQSKSYLGNSSLGRNYEEISDNLRNRISSSQKWFSLFLSEKESTFLSHYGKDKRRASWVSSFFASI